MKRIYTAFLAVMLLMIFMINAFSINIDGIDINNEWHDSATYNLVNNDSNCNITFGVVKVKFDNQNSAVYLNFMFIDPMLERGNLNCGAKISVEGCSPFVIVAGNSPINNEIDIYSFDAAVAADDNNGATCEVRIGFKEGMPRELFCDVQLIDSQGEPSNCYYLNLINEGYSEPTVMDIMPTADNDDPFYNPDLLSTTVKTTKPKTSRYKKETEPSYSKKKRTTTTLPPTTKFVVPNEPMCYTGRVKPTYTNKVVATEQTLHNNDGVTVYYYEKEIIISQVPVIVQITATKQAESSEIITTESTYEYIQPQSTENFSEITVSATDNPQISLKESKDYKKLSLAFGAVAFAVIAVAGVFVAKKK